MHYQDRIAISLLSFKMYYKICPANSSSSIFHSYLVQPTPSIWCFKFLGDIQCGTPFLLPISFSLAILVCEQGSERWRLEGNSKEKDRGRPWPTIQRIQRAVKNSKQGNQLSTHQNLLPITSQKVLRCLPLFEKEKGFL